MFNYKLIDIKSLNKEKCGLVESPLYSKEVASIFRELATA